MPLTENENPHSKEKEKNTKPSLVTLHEESTAKNNEEVSTSSTPDSSQKLSDKKAENTSQEENKAEKEKSKDGEKKSKSSNSREEEKGRGHRSRRDSHSSSSSGHHHHHHRHGSRRKSVKHGDSSGLQRQGSRKSSGGSSAKDSGSGKESEGQSPRHRRSRSQSSVKGDGLEPLGSPRHSVEGAKKFPDSPLSDRKTKIEQLQERHRERRSLHDSASKLSNKEGSRKSSLGSEGEDKSLQESTHHHHLHHKSPKRSMSERRRSTRPHAGSVYESRRRSSSVGVATISCRRASVRISDRKTSIVLPITDRRLSVSQEILSLADITTKSNGSTLQLEYPYKDTTDHRPYMSPGLSGAYKAPGAEVLIASMIMIVGVVALITSFATGIRVWMIVGAVCMGVGASFMLLGCCWVCARDRQKQEAEDLEKNILTSKQLMKLADRSPSTCSQRSGIPGQHMV